MISTGNICQGSYQFTSNKTTYISLCAVISWTTIFLNFKIILLFYTLDLFSHLLYCNDDSARFYHREAVSTTRYYLFSKLLNQRTLWSDFMLFTLWQCLLKNDLPAKHNVKFVGLQQNCHWDRKWFFINTFAYHIDLKYIIFVSVLLTLLVNDLQLYSLLKASIPKADQGIETMKDIFIDLSKGSVRFNTHVPR